MMKREVCQFASVTSINGIECLAFLTESRFCWLPVSAPSAARSAALVVAASSTAPITSCALEKVNIAAFDPDDVNSIQLADVLQVSSGRRLPSAVYTLWHPTPPANDANAIGSPNSLLVPTPTRTPTKAGASGQVESPSTRRNGPSDETIHTASSTPLSTSTSQQRQAGNDNEAFNQSRSIPSVSRVGIAPSGGTFAPKPSAPAPANNERHFCIYTTAHRDVELRLYRLCVQCCDATLAAEWLSAIRRALALVCEAQQRPRNLICFIHPTSGRGLGKQLFQKVHPYFVLSGIHVEAIVTQRSNQAFETIMSHPDLSSFDGILCVGGDGTLTEILRGVMMRTRRDAGLPINVEGFREQRADGGVANEHSITSPEVAARVPIGVIPAGSTDATAFSLYGCNDAITCALRICRGDRLPVDVATVYRGSRFLRYCMNCCSYGFLGDVIASAEQLRFLGPLRYDVLAVAAWFRNDSYPVELDMTLASDADCACSSVMNDSSDNHAELAARSERSTISRSHASTTRDRPSNRNSRDLEYARSWRPCYAGCSVCHCSCAARPPRTASFTDLAGRKDDWQSSANDIDSCEPDRLADVEQRRLRLTGSFLAIISNTLTCRNDKTRAGTAPLVHHGDGVAQVTLLRRCSRFDIIRFFSRLSTAESEISPAACMRYATLGNSTFTESVNSFNRKVANLTSDLSFTETYRVTEFRLRPIAKALADQHNGSSIIEVAQEADNHDLSVSTPNPSTSSLNQSSQQLTADANGTKAMKRSNSATSVGSKQREKKPFGRWNGDGELVEQDDTEWTTVRMNRQLVQVFAAGIPSPEYLREMRIASQKRATNPQLSRCSPKLFRFDRVQLRTEKILDSVAVCCAAGPKVTRRVKQYETSSSSTHRRNVMHTPNGGLGTNSNNASRYTIDSTVEIVDEDVVVTSQPRQVFSLPDPSDCEHEPATDASATDSEKHSGAETEPPEVVLLTHF